jgi:hypothetical protein
VRSERRQGFLGVESAQYRKQGHRTTGAERGGVVGVIIRTFAKGAWTISHGAGLTLRLRRLRRSHGGEKGVLSVRRDSWVRSEGGVVVCLWRVRGKFRRGADWGGSRVFINTKSGEHGRGTCCVNGQKAKAQKARPFHTAFWWAGADIRFRGTRRLCCPFQRV